VGRLRAHLYHRFHVSPLLLESADGRLRFRLRAPRVALMGGDPSPVTPERSGVPKPSEHREISRDGRVRERETAS
jgi:hypothetical protein